MDSAELELLREIFKKPENFQKGQIIVLEERLKQQPDFDGGELKKLMSNTLSKYKRTKQFFSGLQPILETSLELIWGKELPSRKIPRSWVEEWNNQQKNISSTEILIGKVPYKLGAQCRLLSLMAGDREGKKLSKYITPPTYYLLDTIRKFYNFGEYGDNPDLLMSHKLPIAFNLLELYETLNVEIG